MTDDDLTVCGPMTVARRAGSTLDLVPAWEVETEDGNRSVYARVLPRQLLGVWRGSRWVRAEELAPVTVCEPRR